jgi:secondary thiamine-phosphate synthase enzyme
VRAAVTEGAAVEIAIRTSRREELVDVTREVADAVGSLKERCGAVLVYCPHTTAGVTINEHADPDVALDLGDALAGLVPRGARWRHAEGNSDGHVKATLVGASVLVPVEEARLLLGTWQGVFFCEFDGPRERRLHVRMLAAC